MQIPSRRKSTWGFGGDSSAGTVAISAITGTILGTGAVALLEGLTIVRTRGEILMWLSAVGTAQDGISGALGLCIVSENAFAVGSTAVPHPITDIAWDGWYWWHAVNLFAPSTTQATLDRVIASQRLEVDSKAMRKIKLSDTVALVWEGVTEVGVVTVNVRFALRQLAKLA